LDVTGDGKITGKIGINMTPTCALDVTGDEKITGKLGINKTPTSALDVTGDEKISGTLTTNNLTVNGNISGSFSFYDIQTHGITNTNVINSGGISVSGSISTGTLTASGGITGGGEFKIGDDTTNTAGGMLIAGRTKTFYPNPSYPYIVPTKRGLEIFWNTVVDSRNYYRNGNSNYDGFAGDTTFMNYAGGYGQGGYSFQTTPGNGITPSANPTVMFEMLNGKNFTINGGISVKNEVIIGNLDNYIKLGFIDNVPVASLPSSSTTLKIYHSAIGAYSYMNAHPLVIKDSSLTVSNANNQLVFPMPECIYVDLLTNNNDIDIVLPNLNINVDSVDPKTEIFRFKIRQTKTAPSRYWSLKVFNNSSSSGGTIYDYQNTSLGTYYYRPGIWYCEVHFYLGNWYVNRFN
jgi:hypothetical protein